MLGCFQLRCRMKVALALSLTLCLLTVPVTLSSKMANIRAAGLVIFRRINSNIEFLLLQASYGIRHWTPPKGHIEEGESGINAAFRETEEECGLNRNQIRCLNSTSFISTYYVNEKFKEVIYWPAEVDPNVQITLSDEHVQYKWLPIREACELANFPALNKILLQVYQTISGKFSTDKHD